tara:strand:- start:24 stop:518 length:495 start_codon:yes stop_codon:yes gene_type:complete
MKKLLPLLLLILVGCSKDPLNYQLLTERDGVHYRKDTNEIFSGPVFNIEGKSTGSIKKGKWNGKFEFYHSNGQLRMYRTYKDGVIIDGPVRSYYENGQLSYEVTMKDGKEDGPLKLYYENGQLSYDETYKNGKKDGLLKSYYENGQLKEESTYKDGELIEQKEY